MSHDWLQQAQQEVDSLTPPNADLLPGSRRGFLQASALAGFASAVAPTGALQAQTITTDTQGLDAAMVSIPTKTGAIPAYMAKPAGKKGLATVVVMHEIFGVHEHIKDVCRRFAKQGYLAVAPEFFHRQGDPSKLTDMAAIFANIVSKATDAQVLGDLQAALDWSVGNGGVKGLAGTTGFCWGGRIVWLASAAMPDLKGGVAWYGRIRTTVNEANPIHPIDIAEKLKWPVLGLYGGADSGIPNSDVDEMKTKLSFGTDASQASEIILYPDTPHAFHADYRPSYRKQQAEDGWKRCLAWFAKTLKA
ncbi:MAG: dienelactone hydrolase family protein [Burkholderiaceae bacterium]|jgi:carboxymethylenebutenolidase